MNILINSDFIAFKTIASPYIHTFVSEVEIITVDANSMRTYEFTDNISNEFRIIGNMPFVTYNGLGITIGRNATNNRIIYLWNNSSSSKDVGVINMYILQKILD